MPLTCLDTDIPEVVLIQPDVFPDPRGFFMETYHRKKYKVSESIPACHSSRAKSSTRSSLRQASPKNGGMALSGKGTRT